MASAASARSFAGLLEDYAAPQSKFPPQRETAFDALEDDVATLTYEHALKAHARYHRSPDPVPPQPDASILRETALPFCEAPALPRAVAPAQPASAPAPPKPASPSPRISAPAPSRSNLSAPRSSRPSQSFANPARRPPPPAATGSPASGPGRAGSPYPTRNKNGDVLWIPGDRSHICTLCIRWPCAGRRRSQRSLRSQGWWFQRSWIGYQWWGGYLWEGGRSASVRAPG